MQALALKYRPKSFEQLIGQDAVATSLAHALDSGRLSHAYLFSGLRGSGKTSMARIFAKALLCDKGPTGKPCEVCDNCVMANEGRHIDIIEMDAASHRKIDDIRELIEQTKYHPASARFKIFIIDEVHMLTKEASNALLKTLEEPPAYVKFILATTDPLKLPVTVLSRTQHFRFKPIAKSAVVAHLVQILKTENIAYEEGALEILARSGSGSLRDTLTLLDQAIIFSREGITQRAIADMLGLLDPAKIGEILDIVLRQDRAGAIEIIKEVENYNAETIIDEMIANLKDKFLRRDAKFSLLMYERFFRILAGAKSMLAISPDNTYAISMMIFMMMEAVNLREIDELIEVGRSLDQGTGAMGSFANDRFSAEPNFSGDGNFRSSPSFAVGSGAGIDSRASANSTPNFNQGAEQGTDRILTPSGAAKAHGGDSNTATGSVAADKLNGTSSDASKRSDTPDTAESERSLAARNDAKSGAAQQDAAVAAGTKTARNGVSSAIKTGAQNEIYENFLAKIYDRDYDLGEKFSKCVEFLKFERSTLYLLSRAQGQDREYLRKGSRAINSVLKSLFGESAAIKIEQGAPQNSDDPAQSEHDRNSARGATATQSKNFTQGAASKSGVDTTRPANSASQSPVNSAAQNFTESPTSSSVQENPAATQAGKQYHKNLTGEQESEQSCAPQINSTANEAQAAKLQTDAARNSEQQNLKNSATQNSAQRNSTTNSNSQNSASNSKLQNSEISVGDDDGEKDDLLRSTDPQNYAAKPRDTSKSVRAAKAGLAELANGAQDGKEILISEINRLFGEPTKITE
ncbi:DNA polymerase III subunit gamma/tau [uncultured Campylobacter sp.]|uniref:DNA polymerase III subunit gamma/tau n=1 Tax=uncultured Campylobacter sp. TaxID=218934 RepID=UPI00260898D8|nr:DNA polymerase III subunit gamma/tau [uncultured Campylobacter sp.]